MLPQFNTSQSLSRSKLNAAAATLGCVPAKNAAACAAACCSHYDSSGQVDCGGYTWDPQQPSPPGKECPVGKPACWLKVLGAKLIKAPSKDARFVSAVTGSAPAPLSNRLGVLAQARTSPAGKYAKAAAFY